MTPKDLAEAIESLIPSITPSDWKVHNTIHGLLIQSEKAHKELPATQWCKPVKNICMLATTGIKKTNGKRANAHLICTLKNNLPLIIDALKVYKP